jgi:hypothetical protein
MAGGKEPSAAARAYLVAYNAAQTVGWGVCLVQVLLHAPKGPEAAYRAGAPAAGAAPRGARRAPLRPRGARPTPRWRPFKHPAPPPRARPARPVAWFQFIAFAEILHAALGGAAGGSSSRRAGAARQLRRPATPQRRPAGARARAPTLPLPQTNPPPPRPGS